MLFGATGHVGRAIAHELHARGYQLSAVVRNAQKAQALLPPQIRMVQAAVTQPDALRGIFEGHDLVISALGKSVSPNDWSRPTFEQVDYQANLNILQEARAAGVKKMVYVSAFGAANWRHLRYFRVHDDFSNALKDSGMPYIILQPPAVMSSFLDLADMARKGWLFTIGSGDSRTNPISERDLARFCADHLGDSNVTIAAGGQTVYTRDEINQLIRRIHAPNKKVHRLPAWSLRAGLPFWKVINRNMYDKLAFFNEVIQHDVLAPAVGPTTLEAYFGA